VPLDVSRYSRNVSRCGVCKEIGSPSVYLLGVGFRDGLVPERNRCKAPLDEHIQTVREQIDIVETTPLQ
jgi:hypothetical protein